MSKSMTVLRVSGGSNPKSVGSAIAIAIKEGNKEIELHSMGAAAVNQATKAISIANTYLASSALRVLSLPYFKDIEIEGKERTLICLKLVIG